MNDTAVEQDLSTAEQHGVQVQVILPAPRGSSTDSNSQGIKTIKQGGVQVKEDPRRYKKPCQVK
jgi:biotin operon repressor